MSEPAAKKSKLSGIAATEEWAALEAHFAQTKDVHMKDLFAADKERFAKFNLNFEEILFDYSKNRITEETMGLLYNLAKKADVSVRLL